VKTAKYLFGGGALATALVSTISYGPFTLGEDLLISGGNFALYAALSLYFYLRSRVKLNFSKEYYEAVERKLESIPSELK